MDPRLSAGTAELDSEMVAPPQVTFTVVVPSVGRESLQHTLRSIAVQLEPGDEVIVVCNDRRDLGTWARNSAMDRANGTHLLFLDDDDEYVVGAFAEMRRFAAEQPGTIGIFREKLLDGSLFWRTPELLEGNVGSALFVVPNDPERLGRWTGSEGNDWNFIRDTAALQGPPVFCDAVVALQRPRGAFTSPWARLRFRLRLGSRLRALGLRS